PLLFNLAFEPLLVALRKRLRGLRLPWGVYITGAYADDLDIGVALSDGRILIVTLEDYCRASNSRINFHKSVYMPLSPTATTLPPGPRPLVFSSTILGFPFGSWVTTWFFPRMVSKRIGMPCTTSWNPPLETSFPATLLFKAVLYS